MIQEKLEIPNYILNILFRDKIYRNIDNKGKGKFYYRVLDELLAESKELNNLIDYFGEPSVDKTIEDFWKLSGPFIKGFKKHLNHFEKKGLFRVENITLEQIKEICDTENFNDKAIPAGFVIDFVFVLQLKEIDWRKIIMHCEEKEEANILEIDDIYSANKQEEVTRKYIYRRYLELGKPESFVISRQNTLIFDYKRVKLFNTLFTLQRKKLISIHGLLVDVNDPELDIFATKSIDSPIPVKYYRVKAKISLNASFFLGIKGENKVEQKKIIQKKHPSERNEMRFNYDMLKWNNQEEVFKRGQGRILEHLLSNATKIYGERTIRNGEPINRKILQQKGNYNSEKSFRNALKEIRKKIKSFPMKIENPQTNNYLLVIKYKN